MSIQWRGAMQKDQIFVKMWWLWIWFKRKNNWVAFIQQQKISKQHFLMIDDMMKEWVFIQVVNYENSYIIK